MSGNLGNPGPDRAEEEPAEVAEEENAGRENNNAEEGEGGEGEGAGRGGRRVFVDLGGGRLVPFEAMEPLLRRLGERGGLRAEGEEGQEEAGEAREGDEMMMMMERFLRNLRVVVMDPNDGDGEEDDEEEEEEEEDEEDDEEENANNARESENKERDGKEEEAIPDWATPGAVVRFQGLEKRKSFNFHVGRVVAITDVSAGRGSDIAAEGLPPVTTIAPAAETTGSAGGASSKKRRVAVELHSVVFGRTAPKARPRTTTTPRKPAAVRPCNLRPVQLTLGPGATAAGIAAPTALPISGGASSSSSPEIAGAAGAGADAAVAAAGDAPLPAPVPELTVLGSVGASMARRLLVDPHGWGLLPEAAERVVGFLRIDPARSSDVVVAGASSHRGDFPLTAALDANESTWWISAPGSFANGRGREWLEFHFGKVVRRVSFIGMKIPPMPSGPLSVREFQVLALRQGLEPSNDPVEENGAEDGPASWLPASPVLRTLNVAQMQEFALVPPVETRAIRLVFTTNAVAGTPGAAGRMMDCVGLLQVAFA